MRASESVREDGTEHACANLHCLTAHPFRELKRLQISSPWAVCEARGGNWSFDPAWADL